ncbi:conserved hypothetical protein [Ixodes scapularis]|uniref:Uncharacterized protein n=1 Tax=Ixodes scapularis TaxID=6945 RepID=B7QEP0_IXOSC|nr:conserved hypothetical protein [Ixodes scapularis]|eukprot:XP_002414004.1 conserved hypothetical protein [Ixodes scapularis]
MRTEQLAASRLRSSRVWSVTIAETSGTRRETVLRRQAARDQVAVRRKMAALRRMANEAPPTRTVCSSLEVSPEPRAAGSDAPVVPVGGAAADPPLCSREGRRRSPERAERSAQSARKRQRSDAAEETGPRDIGQRKAMAWRPRRGQGADGSAGRPGAADADPAVPSGVEPTWPPTAAAPRPGANGGGKRRVLGADR